MSGLGLAAALTEGLIAEVFRVDVSKALDPLDERDFLIISQRLANQVRVVDSAHHADVLREALHTLDVDWTSMSEAQKDRVIEAARKTVKPPLPRQIARIQGMYEVAGQQVANGVAKSVKGRYGLDIGAGFNKQSEGFGARVAAAQAHFVRDEYGRRADAMSKLARGIVAAGAERGADRYEIGAVLHEQLTAQGLNRSRSYCETVAGVYVNRARTHASLLSYDQDDITHFVFDAVLDEATTMQCKFMNGRRFEVRQTLSKLREVEELDDPGDVKNVTPWLAEGRDEAGAPQVYFKERDGSRTAVATEGANGSDFHAHMSDAELAKRGITAPPLHGNCRSTIVPDLSADGRSGYRAPPPAPEPPKPPRKPRAAAPPPPVEAPVVAIPVTEPVVSAPAVPIAEASRKPLLPTPPLAMKGDARFEPLENLGPWSDASARSGDRRDALELLGNMPQPADKKLVGRVFAEDAGIPVAKKVPAEIKGITDHDVSLMVGQPDSGRFIYLDEVMATQGTVDRKLVDRFIRATPGANEGYYDEASGLVLDRPIAIRGKDGKLYWYDEQSHARAMAARLRGANDISAFVVDQDWLATRRPFKDEGEFVELLHGALTKKKGADVRQLVRRQMAQLDPNLASRDAALKRLGSRAGADKYKVCTPREMGADAAAQHHWDGTIDMGTDYHNRLVDGLFNFHNDVREKVAAGMSRAEAIAYAKKQMAQGPAANALSALFHEESHGMSPILSGAYDAEGVGLEEALTELNARRLTRKFLGEANIPSTHGSSTPFPTASGRFFNESGGAYNKYINRLYGHLADAGVPPAQVGRIIEGGISKTRGGHVPHRSVGLTPHDQRELFVQALDVTPAQRDKIRTALANDTLMH